ncbi:MAG: hypothetical protein E7521_05265, partial [Ruminococcaceae bacterium]|nr:hypothetical protein [Oscillospiraceae bacterium]
MSYVAVYDRTIFYNPSNKYCIISVKSTDQNIPQQARSAYRHRDNMIRFVAVGYELPRTDKVLGNDILYPLGKRNIRAYLSAENVIKHVNRKFILVFRHNHFIS